MSQDLIATHFGDVVVTHGPGDCLPPCTIHAPSDHHMVSWPQRWRGDLKVITRVCEHNSDHLDPDDLAARRPGAACPTGCDGCCAPR